MKKQSENKFFLQSLSYYILFCSYTTSTRSADVIAVLEGGRVVETGSYQELAGKEGGVFRRLQQLGKLAQS